MKAAKTLFGILAIASALAIQAQAQNFLTNGLVAYYPFNGNANDASGNGHDGTNINATLAPDRFGIPNQCYSFNGTNSHVDIGSSIQLGKPHDAMTISVWFLLRNVFNPNFDKDFVLVSDYSSPTDGYSLFAELDFKDYGGVTNELHWVDSSYPVPSFECYSPTVVNDNRWHSYTVALDGVGTTRLYVDGVFSSQAAYDASLNYMGNPQFWRIGADLFNGQIWNVLNGSIDDVRFYNRALSTNEVQQLYAYELQPVVGLKQAFKPALSNLYLGTNYQLQLSTDMNSWTNFGSPFTPTNSVMDYPQYFDTDIWGKLFFRLQTAP